jgi:hypothetical protein
MTPATTGTTPSGQTTGTTPSGQTTGQAQAAQLEPATASDFKNGATVYDQKGAVVGHIQSFSSDSAVISSGKIRATIPLSSFGRGDKGLVIGMSKAEFEAAAAKKTTTTAKTK